MQLSELVKELRNEKAKCSTHCTCWDCIDRDCELYGEQHVPPSKCQFYLNRELERRNEGVSNGSDN